MSKNEISLEEFREILIERNGIRRQMAINRHQKDIQRIQDMRSKVGQHPLDFCPKELWAMIFDLFSAEEKESTRTVHDLFYNMLKEHRIRDIFFPLLLSSGKFQPFAEIPLLRQVSKSFRNEIDQNFEQKLMKHMRLELSGNTVRNFPSSTRLRLRCHQTFHKVIQESFHGPEGERPTRLVQRSLVVFLSPDTINPTRNHEENFLQFKNDVKTFLEHLGSQVLRFLFVFSGMEACGQADADVYSLLCDWLAFMPNLKGFGVDFSSNDEMKVSLEKVIRDKPLPVLRDLEKLELDVTTRSETTIRINEAILKTYRHVKVFTLVGLLQPGDSISPKTIELVRSLNLEAVSFTNEGTSSYIPNCQINTTWPLKRIHMSIRDDESTSMESIFRFLENFQGLEHLYLGIGSVTSDAETYLRLPNLAHFKGRVCYSCWDEFTWVNDPKMRFFTSLQFLLYNTKLEWIHWNAGGLPMNNDVIDGYKARPDCFIQFENGLRDLTDSNLWDVFPFLKFVTVKYFQLDGGIIDRKLMQKENIYQRRELIYSKCLVN